MTYIANSNQMTDAYQIIPAGQVIPDGALSEASIKTLIASGLVSEVSDDEAAAVKLPKEG